MANQENKFIKIGLRYSSIGGDKSLQGLQEYLNSPQFYKNFFSEESNDIFTTNNGLNPNIIGESSTNNDTSYN